MSMPRRPEPPTAPQAAALPEMGPCPRGWRTVEVEGIDVCEPWPESGRADCGTSAFHLPGSAGCARVGPACPTGDFADGLPATGVLYVTADGTGDIGADGSRARPFESIEAALAAASPGSTIALSKGEHVLTDGLRLESAITMVGACTEATVVRNAPEMPVAGAPLDSTLKLTAAGAAVRSLTVTGDRAGLLVNAADTTIEGVVVDRAYALGLGLLGGADVVVRDFVVRGTRPAVDGRFGRGVNADSGAHATFERVALVENREVAVSVSDTGTTVSLTNAVIADTLPRADDDWFGRAFAVQGGTVRVEASAIEHNRHDAAFVKDATFEMVDSVLRDTEPQQTETHYGSGMLLSGSDVMLQRLRIERNTSVGVLAGSGSTLRAEDLVVIDSAPRPTGDAGLGIEVTGGATAQVSRAYLAGHAAAAVAVTEASQLTVEDFTIRRSVGRLDGGDGVGVSLTDDAVFTATRLDIENVRDAGIYVRTGSRADITDLRIADVRFDLVDRDYGRSISVEMGGSLTLERARLERADQAHLVVLMGSTATLSNLAIIGPNPPDDGRGNIQLLGMGLAVQENSQVTADRVSVLDTIGFGVLVGDEGSALVATNLAIDSVDTTTPFDVGPFGRGMQVQRGASIEGSAIDVRRSHSYGLVSANPGSQMRLEDVTVRDTLTACERGECGEEGGYGAAALFEGQMRLERFGILDNAVCGAQVARQGQLDLVDGTVRGHPIGVNIQNDGYDFGRLSTDVRFVDNVRNIDADNLPLPDPDVDVF